MASTACADGPKLPLGTPVGKTSRVVSPQLVQVKRGSRYSSTIGSIFGQVGHRMDEGLGIVTKESQTATPTRGWLAFDRLANPLGRDQSAVRLAMSALPNALPPTGWSGWPLLHPDRIGRGGLGRIGGFEFRPALKIVDPILELSDAPLVELNECEDRRLKFRRGRPP